MSPTRWWPPVGVAGMILLGLAVGKGSTPLDDWFQAADHNQLDGLSYLAKPLALAILEVTVVGVALYRRCWRLALAAVVFPPAAYLLVQFIKPLFGRTIGDGLAYPSGHITVTTIVLGLVVLVAGGALWAVVFAVIYVSLAMVGVGSTFHYFTDTAGGVLLGTAVVCLAALIASRDLTRVNPGAIYVTRGG
ncbi:phosphatase PAP2 family protein [Mycobacterium sp. NPDC051804]|uniref:phosphatase PAP2 family protein n=1 Tax=Mycobacterium sp. NPDC051804 TaxID=3364295 RepID=UPI0037AF3EFD